AWQLERDGVGVHASVTPQVSTNDTAGAVAAAIGGLGITSTTSWAYQQELQAGTLVQLFADWTIGVLPAHAYIPMGRATRQAARAFVDYIAAELDALTGR
ncbi:LysR substrate-binding domain-containing protein, partial [Paludibacterium sp.]|uniref:LysR substrate-binding domain-containing protein n=1 Tax=Paludibacterium sp. TaxID=1917523 RepID=UPI0025CC739F